MRELQATGKQVKALDNRPDLPLDLRETWDAFWILNRSRQQGWSTGPIPVSEVAAFVGMFGIRRPNFFLRCIMIMDAIWLEHASKKADAKKRSSQSAGPSVRKPRRKHGHRRT